MLCLRSAILDLFFPMLYTVKYLCNLRHAGVVLPARLLVSQNLQATGSGNLMWRALRVWLM